jgi:hypothetical protein
VTRHPWLYGAVVGVVFAVLWETFIFRGSVTARVALGTIMGVLWGVTQGAVASYKKGSPPGRSN